MSVSGLYGDWKMVLQDWPGLNKPVTGDFCNFKKRDDGVAIICADDFLQKIPEVALDGHKLRMRWGGALNHTIYDAVRDENGTFDGEIIQRRWESSFTASRRIWSASQRRPWKRRKTA